MKIKPQPGYALLQIVAPDFEETGAGRIIIDENKDTSFFNRFKVLELGEANLETATASKPIRTYKKDDIVILSVAGTQVGVPGTLRNPDGKLIDVFMVDQRQIIATIEGDIGKDIEPEALKPMIVPPSNVN